MGVGHSAWHMGYGYWALALTVRRHQHVPSDAAHSRMLLLCLLAHASTALPSIQPQWHKQVMTPRVSPHASLANASCAAALPLLLPALLPGPLRATSLLPSTSSITRISSSLPWLRCCDTARSIGRDEAAVEIACMDA